MEFTLNPCTFKYFLTKQLHKFNVEINIKLLPLCLVPYTKLSATFHLTHQCNLRCTYCYTGEKLNIPMSKATADKGIDFVFAEARKNGIEKLLIMFFGGEPLIEKDLLLHIADRFIREKGDIEVNFQMSTNGTLLRPDLLDELLRRRICR